MVGTLEWSKELPVSITHGSSSCRTTKGLFHTNNLPNSTTCYSIAWSAYFKHNTHKFHLEQCRITSMPRRGLLHHQASYMHTLPAIFHPVSPLPNLPSLVLPVHYSVSLCQPINIFLYFISVSNSTLLLKLGMAA